MNPDDDQVSGGWFPKYRLEALTDGIYAIAMTLLVLTILPQAGNPDPVPVIIAKLVPDFTHYIIAFFSLAAFWIGHHVQFHRIRFINRRMLWLNILYLMFVCLVPFSTALSGDYSNTPMASMVLETNLLIIGLLSYTVWWYATDNYRFIDRKVSQKSIELGKKRNIIIPFLSLVGIFLALLGVTWSAAVYFLIPVFFYRFRYHE